MSLRPRRAVRSLKEDKHDAEPSPDVVVYGCVDSMVSTIVKDNLREVFEQRLTKARRPGATETIEDVLRDKDFSTAAFKLRKEWPTGLHQLMTTGEQPAIRIKIPESAWIEYEEEEDSSPSKKKRSTISFTEEATSSSTDQSSDSSNEKSSPEQTIEEEKKKVTPKSTPKKRTEAEKKKKERKSDVTKECDKKITVDKKDEKQAAKVTEPESTEKTNSPVIADVNMDDEPIVKAQEDDEIDIVLNDTDEKDQHIGKPLEQEDAQATDNHDKVIDKLASQTPSDEKDDNENNQVKEETELTQGMGAIDTTSDPGDTAEVSIESDSELNNTGSDNGGKEPTIEVVEEKADLKAEIEENEKRSTLQAEESVETKGSELISDDDQTLEVKSEILNEMPRAGDEDEDPAFDQEEQKQTSEVSGENECIDDEKDGESLDDEPAAKKMRQDE